MEQVKQVSPLADFMAGCRVRIEASPETVFQFLVDERRMLLWKGVEAQLDPRPGGIFRVVVKPGSIAVGEYLEIDPPRSVSFSWGWEGEGSPLPVGSSKVRITLEPDGGGTVLSLVHSALPSRQMAEAHTEGWRHFLARLEVAGAGGDPGPDPWLQTAS